MVCVCDQVQVGVCASEQVQESKWLYRKNPSQCFREKSKETQEVVFLLVWTPTWDKPHWSLWSFDLWGITQLRSSIWRWSPKSPRYVCGFFLHILIILQQHFVPCNDEKRKKQEKTQRERTTKQSVCPAKAKEVLKHCFEVQVGILAHLVCAACIGDAKTGRLQNCRGMYFATST